MILPASGAGRPQAPRTPLARVKPGPYRPHTTSPQRGAERWPARKLGPDAALKTAPALSPLARPRPAFRPGSTAGTAIRHRCCPGAHAIRIPASDG
uniref:Uncharacterized protein n=1 Tax=Ralstonia solanacearum TaxID=305 RepID=A0A0S4VC00_RALSL|nr:protein of unknown function [Ralstonia solanacearum]